MLILCHWKEILFINSTFLFSKDKQDPSGFSYKTTQEKMIVLLCFLPLYIMSVFFRVTTFVALFTYLNVWAFGPMIVSWVLNIASFNLAKQEHISPDHTIPHQHASSFLVATVGVFIPLCFTETPSGDL